MGTLKQILKTYKVVMPLKWDVHLPYIFFVYREVPNETTGFTSFEVLYARHVRGPLVILLGPVGRSNRGTNIGSKLSDGILFILSLFNNTFCS